MSRPHFSPGFFAACLLLLVCWPWPKAHGAERVTIGMLAYRPAEELAARWQPTAGYLSSTLAGYEFVIEPLNYPELEEAVNTRRVDFVLTNPSHYVALAHRFGLSSPLASLVRLEQGQPLSAFGGVIAVAAERDELRHLGDLRGKTLATPDIASFGGYQAQVFELRRAGLKIPEEVKILATGMPHDRAIDAVLAGEADAALVRSGLLEEMALEEKIDAARLRVLNRQQLPAFPFALSTRLYPEWPITALPHVDEQLARRVVAALYLLSFADEAAQAADYHSWAIPQDYQPVRALLEELRLPPFDAAPSFTLGDVWQRYRLKIFLVALGGAATFVLALGLLVSNCRLAASRRALRESEEKYRRLVENLSSEYFFYRCDASGNLEYVSASASAMLGWSQDELTGHYSRFMAEHPANQEVAEKTALVLAGERQPPYLFIARHKDGGERWLEVSESRVFDGSGRVVGLEGLAHDVSERKAVEAALLRSNAELEQFAYSISHDMRQPLRMIGGHLQLLELSLGERLEQNDRDSLHFAVDGARRLDAMIVSLLEYSRIGRKTQPLIPLESRQSLDEALRFLQPLIDEKQARLVIEGVWPQVTASQDELSRLFQNLIGNALKYHREGCPPEVRVYSQLRAGQWRVEVSDQGIGIDPAQLHRLFQFYSRLQPHSRFEGTGMGLALCRRIVEHHRGRIWASSAGDGQGSTFTFEIPPDLAADVVE